MPTLKINKDSDLHRKLCKKIFGRVRLAEQEHTRKHDRWRDAEERTLGFLPETDKDRARRNKRESGGVPTYTTIQIPYSYAVLMSSHTYWTSVFFARSPIHQYQGRHGEGEQQTKAMEALISYQVDVGMMTGLYDSWLYDAVKYGLGVLGQYWDRQKLHYGTLDEMTDPLTGKTNLYQTTQEIEGYVGNRAFNVSPWDFMHDPRVSLKNFQKGEFCCYRVRQGWNQVLERKDQGFYNENIQFLKDHISVDRSRALASQQLVRPQFDKILYEDELEKVGHPAGFIGWEFYVNLIPEEWGVGKTKYPQKWCFTITEDLQLIIGAQPLGYVHCQFPFDVLECEVEGYGLYARGIPEIMAPIQNTVDWLLNTHFYNVRACLNNQFIVDPSKLVIKDVRNSGPGFLWRLRPEAFGTDISKMFMQVQVQDITRSNMADFQA